MLEGWTILALSKEPCEERGQGAWTGAKDLPALIDCWAHLVGAPDWTRAAGTQARCRARY